MAELPFGRAGALRCDGRSRPQDDLPGTLRDGETRHSQGSGNRRRLSEVESGAAAQARDGQHKDDPAGSMTSARSSHLLSQFSYVSGDYKDPATFTALKKALGKARRPALLSGHPALAFRDGDQRPWRREIGRSRARHCRKAVRTRPGLRPRAQSRRALGVP